MLSAAFRASVKLNSFVDYFLFLVTEAMCLGFFGDIFSKHYDSAINRFLNMAEVKGQLGWEANIFPVDITRSMFSFCSSMLQWNCLKYLIRDKVGSF